MFTELLARLISDMKACFYAEEAFYAEPYCLFGRWYTTNGTYAGDSVKQVQRLQFLEDLS